ncbi:MAG: MATE family efflux transporter [Sphaerochaetaceae bacterium]|nr:MATE family efflux transporter [Sphaerochaetaceae bacterium]
MGRRTETDMTQGNIVRLIAYFAFPLLLANIFQQLYNTVDTWVVGNFVGKNSFSAVGTLASVINTIIGFFIGFSNGAGVVISHFFGAKDEEKTSVATHTFFASTLILCVLFTFLGLALIPLLIKLVNSPAEVAVEQVIYLRIYFAGASGLLIYNMGSSILRAVGNSRYSLYFIIISASMNIVLDLLFVIVFHMGTAGVAYATIIAQGVSALSVLVVLFRTDSCVKISLNKVKIDWNILKKIFAVGLPSALQMSVTAFSNVFVQSYINFFGSDVMGGYTAFNKLDQLILLPMMAISMATQTFVGQNLGMSLTERARKGVKTSVLMALFSTIVLVIPMMALAPTLVRFFIEESETLVIHYGTLFITTISPFYLFCVFNQIYGGALRGAGKSKIPMIVMLLSFVLFRQLYLYVVANYISNTVIPIVMGYPAGWMLCSLILYICYKIHFSDKKMLESRIAD